LHDTPTVSAFQRSGRALSHGCVRVQQPQALAEWVLATDPQWNTQQIGRAMHAGAERWVRLSTPIPVHIAYFTAIADDHGRVTFLPDPYGYDARQSAPHAPAPHAGGGSLLARQR